MNFKAFFSEAQKEGISPFEISYEVSSTLSVKIYNDNIEAYKISNDTNFFGRGICGGKLGSFSSDRVDKKVAPLMMAAIKDSAANGLAGDKDLFISKGLKYRRIHNFSKTTEAYKPEYIIKIGQDLSAAIRNADKRIEVCQMEIGRTENLSVMENSNLLKLKAKSNYVYCAVFAMIKDGDKVESYEDEFILNDFESFSIDKTAKDIAAKAAAELGGESVKTGKYSIIYSPDCVALLLPALLMQLSAFDCRQHLSLFEGKKGQQVLSKKLTVIENPWANNPFSAAFDDEGMPTSKKALIKNGVLMTYLYDLEEAKIAHVSSTGSGYRQKGNIRPAFSFLSVKKGSKSFAELVSKVHSGLYITNLQGIGTGMNPQTGNYSLQAGGFLIEDGKISKPVTLITVAGNILADFGKIIGVADDMKLTDFYVGMECPSIAIRKLAVSGK